MSDRSPQLSALRGQGLHHQDSLGCPAPKRNLSGNNSRNLRGHPGLGWVEEGSSWDWWRPEQGHGLWAGSWLPALWPCLGSGNMGLECEEGPEEVRRGANSAAASLGQAWGEAVT